MKEARSNPYIWVTWLTKLMAGENQCIWASWFRSHYTYDKKPSDFDLVKWSADHNQMLLEREKIYKDDGYQVYTEDQNSFKLEGENGALMSGKADLVAIKDGVGLVEDCKTGKPRNADQMQVMIYMLVLPLSVPHCKDMIIDGLVKYKNDEVHIPASKIDDALRALLKNTINQVSDDLEPGKVPSYAECRFCDITGEYCSERIEKGSEKITDHGLF